MNHNGMNLEGEVDDNFRFLSKLPGGEDTFPRRHKHDATGSANVVHTSDRARVKYWEPRYQSVRDIPQNVYAEPFRKHKDSLAFRRELEQRNEIEKRILFQLKKEEEDRKWKEEKERKFRLQEERWQQELEMMKSKKRQIGNFVEPPKIPARYSQFPDREDSYLLRRTNYYIEASERFRNMKPEDRQEVTTAAAPAPPPMPPPALPMFNYLPLGTKQQNKPNVHFVPWASDLELGKKSLRKVERRVEEKPLEPEPINFKEKLSKIIDSQAKVMKNNGKVPRPPVLEANIVNTHGYRPQVHHDTIKTLPKSAMVGKLNEIFENGVSRNPSLGGVDMDERRREAIDRIRNKSDERNFARSSFKPEYPSGSFTRGNSNGYMDHQSFNGSRQSCNNMGFS